MVAGPAEPPPDGWTALDRLVATGLCAVMGLGLIFLVGLVRDALKPNEPYAAHVGLSLDQCAAAQPDLSAAQALAFCRHPVPKAR